MKLKILSLVLIIMLVSFPVTPVMATSIQKDCQIAVTEDNLKTYIKQHAIAGHEEHCVVVDSEIKDFKPAKECHNPAHKHKQYKQHEFLKLCDLNSIMVNDVCKIQYKCLDQNGDKWRVDIEGKIGKQYEGSILDEEFWNGEYWKHPIIKSPCATYGYSHTYDLNTINTTDLLQLFNLMVNIDQYLDATGTDVLIDLAQDCVEGGVGIASTLVTVAKYGGRIPYIGEAILVAVGTGFAIYALYQVADELQKAKVLKKQLESTAKKISRHPCFID